MAQNTDQPEEKKASENTQETPAVSAAENTAASAAKTDNLAFTNPDEYKHKHGEHKDGEHHHHHHHHGHDADEVFTSWGVETPKQFTADELQRILKALDSGEYGAILRAKGIVPAADGTWLHFDYVPGEQDIRTGAADYTGRLCVIGAQLNEAALKTLFGGEA